MSEAGALSTTCWTPQLVIATVPLVALAVPFEVSVEVAVDAVVESTAVV